MGHPAVPHCAAHTPEPTCVPGAMPAPQPVPSLPVVSPRSHLLQGQRLGAWCRRRKSEAPLPSLFAGKRGGSWVSPSFQEGLDVSCKHGRQSKSTSAWKYFKQQLKNRKSPKQPRSGNSPFPRRGSVTGAVGVPQSAFTIFTPTPAPCLSPLLCEVPVHLPKAQPPDSDALPGPGGTPSIARSHGAHLAMSADSLPLYKPRPGLSSPTDLPPVVSSNPVRTSLTD